MTEVTGRLENWKYDNFWHWLRGNLYADSKGRFPDGTIIHTSTIRVSKEEAHKLEEGMTIKTSNSVYLLGTPLKSEVID